MPGVISAFSTRSQQKRTWLIVCALVVGACTALLLRPAPISTSNAPAPLAGHPAPTFSLPVLHGMTAGPSLSLHSYLGHPLLLQFWAVDCPSCAAERPALLGASGAFRAHGGRVLGIDAYIEPPGLVGSYVRAHAEPYDPILLDPNGDVIYRYRVSYVPMNYFIGADGVIRSLVVGPMSEAAFNRAFRQLETATG